MADYNLNNIDSSESIYKIGDIVCCSEVGRSYVIGRIENRCINYCQIKALIPADYPTKPYSTTFKMWYEERIIIRAATDGEIAFYLLSVDTV